jgi:hypothetical protein
MIEIGKSTFNIYIYKNDKWTMFNSKTVTTTRGYPCCGVFRCAPGEDDLKS